MIRIRRRSRVPAPEAPGVVVVGAGFAGLATLRTGRSGSGFGGTLAWLARLAPHVIGLLGNRNRFPTLFNLSWRYLTWAHGGGLIVGDDPPEEG